MTTSINKRIEETATTALKIALLKCPILESFIDSNDKTPSWDGTVFVYKNEMQKKADLLGRVPIQIKGTERAITSDTTTFSCEISDIGNYYRDGGCVFFLISVNTSSGAATIYYSSLLVFDLKMLLDSAGQHKSIRIKLLKFPQDDPKEMACIFMSFVENHRKQTSFIGKEFASLEKLKSKGIEIETLSFSTSGVGLYVDDIGSFISTHDLYLYAKPIGLDIDIPVDKISNAIVSKPVYGKVLIKDTEYYPSYSVIYKNGKSILRLGKGISILLCPQKNEMNVTLSCTGTLTDYIQDTSCFVDMIESQEITLNGARVPFSKKNKIVLSKHKLSLNYLKDIKKMLDHLGVTEELQCNNLSNKDETNIRNFVNAILHNGKLGFPNADNSIIYGPIKISNLEIWIWGIKQDNGYYQIENFFDQHGIVFFENDDISQSNPIHASHYLLLDQEAFIHASNIDFNLVKKDLCSMTHHPILIEHMTQTMLNILRGFDEQREKDDRLLDLAEAICSWLSLGKEESENPLIRLNQLQIIKRRRPLTVKESIELGKFTDIKHSAIIRCGAYLLLEATDEAQLCFDELPQETQAEFITYPICHFGKLIHGGTQ